MLKSEEFLRKGLEEVLAPDTDEQGRPKEQDSVEAGAAIARPVDPFFKIKPEGKLVQRKGRADPVK